jgi:hypothetical protein
MKILNEGKVPSKKALLYMLSNNIPSRFGVDGREEWRQDR